MMSDTTPLFESEEYSSLEWTNEERSRELNDLMDYEKAKRAELLRSEQRRRAMELDAIKNAYRATKTKKKLTTTKVFMWFIFVNCAIIELYAMFTMFFLGDLSALTALIGAVIGEAMTFAVYCAKAYNETKQEEQIKLEREQFKANRPVEEFVEEIVETTAKAE